jgi:mannose-1-phosphate guanylyltransferase
VYETDRYWNDIGSVPQYLLGNFDAVAGVVEVELDGTLTEGSADEERPSAQEGEWQLTGRVLLGDGAEVERQARIDGPAVVGPGCRVGERALIKGSVLLPGAEVAPDSFLLGSIAGRRGRLAGGEGKP